MRTRAIIFCLGWSSLLFGASVPQVATLDANEIKDTSARLKGQIVDDGGEWCWVRFRWKKQSDSSWTVFPWDYGNMYRAGNPTGTWLYNLVPLTTYEFCFQAQNSASESDWTPSRTFKTGPLTPEVHTNSCIWRTKDEALVPLYLANTGGQACKVRFVYWKEGGPELTTPWYCCLDKAGSYSESLEGLEPWTTYSYRAEANNLAGTASGSVKTFKTYGGPTYVSADLNTYWDLSVTADQSFYQLGDEVRWQVHASIVGPSRGIKSFSFDLCDTRQKEWLPAPEAVKVPTWVYPGVYVDNFRGLDDPHHVYGYFNYKNYFGVAPGVSGGGRCPSSTICGLGASLFLNPLDNIFIEGLDKTGGLLCEGKYTVTRPGFHDLWASFKSGSVWIDDDGNSEAIGDWGGDGAHFYVYAIPPGFVWDTNHLDVIGRHMGETGCAKSNDWCDGADLHHDGEVDLLDVDWFFANAGSRIDVIDDMYTYQDVLVPGGPDGPEQLIVVGPQGLAVGTSGSKLVFAADDLLNGEQLWQVDLQTRELNVTDLCPGLKGSKHTLWATIGNDVYYVALSREEGVPDVHHGGLSYTRRFWSLYRLPGNGRTVELVKPDIVVSEWWPRGYTLVPDPCARCLYYIESSCYEWTPPGWHYVHCWTGRPSL